MDRFCATCGKQLQPDQSFCDKCGSPWAAAAETAPAAATPLPVAAQPVVHQAATSPPASGHRGRTLLIVALTVIALGIGGWFFLINRADARSAAVASSSTSSSTALTSSIPAAAPDRTSVQPPSVAPTSSGTAGETLAATAAATEAAAGSKPCSLVTRAEMAAILGSTIVKVTANDLTCSYFTDGSLSAHVDTTWTGGKDAFAQVKGFNSAPGLAEPVAGIGDEAYMQAAGVLHVLQGDTYVVINSREYPKELETESAIARKALQKLLK